MSKPVFPGNLLDFREGEIGVEGNFTVVEAVSNHFSNNISNYITPAIKNSEPLPSPSGGVTVQWTVTGERSETDEVL